MTPLSTAPQVVPHRHALYAWVPPWGPPLATCALPKGQRRVHVLPSPKSQPRTGHTREPDPTNNVLKHTTTRETQTHVLPSPQVIPTHVPHTTYTLGISCRTSREYTTRIKRTQIE